MIRAIYGVSSRFEFGMWNHRVYKFRDKGTAEKWLNTEEADFRMRELMTKAEATKLAGNRAVANAEEIIYDVPEGRIPVTDEGLKNEIIEYALRRIGSTRIGLLDGMTLIYQDRWYDITVDNGNVGVDEV